MTQFDLYSYNNGVIANAAAYGITDTTDPCFTSTPLSPAASTACGLNGQNIGSFAYWDSIDPTATTQALWAQGFEQALAVPEPTSLSLLCLGASLAVTRRRRQPKRAP